MSKFYELYFSPTGGTLESVKILGPEIFGILGMEPVPVNLRNLVRDGGELPAFSAEDLCLVSVPAFAGRVPMPAAELLQKLDETLDQKSTPKRKKFFDTLKDFFD